MFIAIVCGMHCLFFFLSFFSLFFFFNSLPGARSSITGAGAGRLGSLHSRTLTELRAPPKQTPKFWNVIKVIAYPLPHQSVSLQMWIDDINYHIPLYIANVFSFILGFFFLYERSAVESSRMGWRTDEGLVGLLGSTVVDVGDGVVNAVAVG